MSWIVYENLVTNDKNDKAVCMLISENSIIKKIVKDSTEFLDAIASFLIEYDEGKQLSKKLYNIFSELLYDIKDIEIGWSFSEKEDTIINNDGVPILYFLNDTDDFSKKTIQYLPEMIRLMKECINSYDKNKARRKYLYEKFSRIVNKIHEK